MKARLRCRNVRSVLWAVEKAPAQTDVTYGKSRVIIVISKVFGANEWRKVFCHEGSRRWSEDK